MWYPGRDPRTEIGHYSKTMEIWVKIGFVRFLHCKILFSPAIHTAPSGRQSAPEANKLIVGSYAPPSWKWRVYINYLEFFCSGNLSILSPFLKSIQSLIRIRYCIKSVCWFESVFILSLNCNSINLATVSSFSWPLYSFDILSSTWTVFCFVLFVFEQILTFWHYRKLQVHLVFLMLSCPRSSHFSKEFWSL